MNDTVKSYLDAIEGDRGVAMRTVFETVSDAMPSGYELIDFHGAPSWVVPLRTYPVTYNAQPLSYVALIAQKSYLSLYLMTTYMSTDDDTAFRRAWAETGLKLNIGKSCLRFRRLDDLSLPLIAQTVAATPPERLIAVYEASRRA